MEAGSSFTFGPISKYSFLKGAANFPTPHLFSGRWHRLAMPLVGCHLSLAIVFSALRSRNRRSKATL